MSECQLWQPGSRAFRDPREAILPGNAGYSRLAEDPGHDCPTDADKGTRYRSSYREVSVAESMGASASDIAQHYDVGNEFYELWLDPHRVYSCALWEAGDDLEAA